MTLEKRSSLRSPSRIISRNFNSRSLSEGNGRALAAAAAAEGLGAAPAPADCRAARWLPAAAAALTGAFSGRLRLDLRMFWSCPANAVAAVAFMDSMVAGVYKG